MNSRIPLVAAAAAGGLLTAAFLQAGVAAADIIGDSGSETGAAATSAATDTDTDNGQTEDGGGETGTDNSDDPLGGLLGGLGGDGDGSGPLGGLVGGGDGDGPLGGLFGGGDSSDMGGSDMPGSGEGFTTSDGLTLDPGSGGFDDVNQLFSDSPLLSIGGGSIAPGADLADQDLYAYGEDGDQLGSVDTGVNTSNILGMESSQFTVNGTDEASAEDPSSADISAALENSDTDFTGDDAFGDDTDLSDVAGALAGADGIELDGDVSASDVTDALSAEDISIGDDADFKADDIADALNSASVGDADDLPADGSVYSITDFTAGSSDLEDMMGGGIYNVYEAVPGEEGADDASITDTLVTPLGNFDLSTPFNAIADLMPGNAESGVDASDSGGGLFGGLGDLFGGSGDEGDGPLGGLLGGGGETGGGDGGDVSASDISSALSDSETDFSSDNVDGDIADDYSQGDLASTLADSDLDFGSDISGSDVSSALDDTSVGDLLDIDNGGFDGADFSPDDIASALSDVGGDDMGAGDETGGLFGDLGSSIFG
jgi:hypothetical protein